MQESMHVFIQAGLQYFLNEKKALECEAIRILEVGFGTGLNALLSLNEAIHHNKKIFYETIEPYPISIEEAEVLNYVSMIDQDLKKEFMQLHTCVFNETVLIHPLFSLIKINSQLQNFNSLNKFNIIYFDAFDPNAQPELWTAEIFKQLFQLLYTNGLLVTYCSKSIARKAMLAAGFSVTKLKGPQGKREIVRAVKE